MTLNISLWYDDIFVNVYKEKESVIRVKQWQTRDSISNSIEGVCPQGQCTVIV